jgi:hypothetical protein
MSFKIEGLDGLIDGLERASRNKQRYEDLKYDVGKRFLENCAKTCGEDTGQLKASFKREPYKGKREWVLDAKHGDTIEAGTKVFYARMVEEGHKLVKVRKTKLKNGRVRRTKKVVGFVPGTHFMLKALEHTDKEIPGMVEKFLNDVAKEAGLNVEK